MNILRQTPFPFSVTYDGLEESTSYILEIYTKKTETILSEEIDSDLNGVISFELPASFQKYDGSYLLYVYTILDDEPDETVVIDSLYIYRPYVNPYLLFDQECDAQEYIKLERTARQIIDTLVGGFYYTIDSLELVGLGADFLPLTKRSNRINKVYENNSLIYDRESPLIGQRAYTLSQDKTALTVAETGSYNRKQSRQVQLPLAASDSLMLYGDDYDQVVALTEIKGSAVFPKDYDYTVVGEWGWSVVPQNIKEATEILIEDLRCGRLSHIGKYVTEYETDQFKVKYSDLSLRGSGNLIVDKILQSYSIPIYRIGVL